MKKVKAFFYILSKSAFLNKNYYKKITKTSFSFSLKYLIGLIFFLNLIFILSFINRYSYYKIKNFFNAASASLANYPQDIIISVQNNTLFTTLDRPYFFWINEDKQQRLLLVIDQSADIKKIDFYKSLFLITPTTIVMHFNNKYYYYPLSILNGLSVNKIKVEQWRLFLNTLSSKLFLYYFIGVIFLFVFFNLVSFLITITYLFIVSSVVFLYFKLFNHRHIHFKKVLQISFHANTFPYLLDYLFLSLPKAIIKLPYPTIISVQSFPLFFLLILILFTIIGVREAYRKD
jgi:hypothetical protein